MTLALGIAVTFVGGLLAGVTLEDAGWTDKHPRAFKWLVYGFLIAAVFVLPALIEVG